MSSQEEKTKVMQSKSKLKGKNIFIDNDLTENESCVQKKLREVATKERQEGKTVKVGYKKLIIEGKDWLWDDTTASIKESNKVKTRSTTADAKN